MNILLVSNMYPDKANPSYGVFVKNQVEVLEMNGFKLDLQVMYKESNSLFKAISYLKHYIMVFLRLLSNNYDFIYVHYASLNAPPILLAKLLKKSITIVTNIHGSDVVPGSKLQQKLTKLTKMIVIKSDLTIVPSEYYKGIIADKFDVSRNRLKVSPSGGINRDVFYPQHQEKNVTSPVIGYVGRIDEGKGWYELLHAFSKFSQKSTYEQSKLIMVGHGKDSDRRDELIKKLSLQDKVITKPLLSQKELLSIYNEIDVFVFPSHRESLGLVGLEAMACGTPVIGSDIGGIKSYLKHGYNGLLTETGSSESIYEQLVNYFNLEQSEVELMRSNALKTAESYEQNVVNKNLISIFNNNLDMNK